MKKCGNESAGIKAVYLVLMSDIKNTKDGLRIKRKYGKYKRKITKIL